ncbi:hypothetical protein CW702_00875 [Candidatus Bathyarchaeota archaeon]|nr:MAG: hypothetical protein CW702_00875 [Candidatus Bathyarchaeota archaeon]
MIEFVAGTALSGVTLILIVTVHLAVRRNVKYATGRLFLRRDETLKALTSLVIGASVFTPSRILGVLYRLEMVPYNIYFAVSALSGTAFMACILYAFWKLLQIIRLEDKVFH